jgi:hypothetical protein
MLRRTYRLAELRPSASCAAALALLLAGCGEDEGLTYQDEVRPIFAQGCTICHNTNRPTGVNIANPFAPNEGLVNSDNSVYHEQCTLMGNQAACSLPSKDVDPGNPDNSMVLAKVDWDSSNPGSCSIKARGGGDCMPLQIAPLSRPATDPLIDDGLADTEVEKIIKWVRDGANNDEYFWAEVQPIFGDQDDLVPGEDRDGDGIAGPGKCSYCHYEGTPNPPELSAPGTARNTGVFKPAPLGLVNVLSYNRARDYRVEPRNPEASVLIGKIIATEPNSDVGAPMPYSFPSLSDAQRETLRAWIADGAPNN